MNVYGSVLLTAGSYIDLFCMLEGICLNGTGTHYQNNRNPAEPTEHSKQSNYVRLPNYVHYATTGKRARKLPKLCP